MQTIKIEGIEYYTVASFAELTNKSQQTIRRYILRGNKIRMLKAIKVNQTVLIPITELTAFPFTICGRSYAIYHYNNDGKIIEGAIA